MEKALKDREKAQQASFKMAWEAQQKMKDEAALVDRTF